MQMEQRGTVCEILPAARSSLVEISLFNEDQLQKEKRYSLVSQKDI